MGSLSFYNAEKEEKLLVFQEVAKEKNIPAFAVEKDWWVTQTLATIFELEIATYILFKGGTSLSKAWGIINRFSEDIDLALDKSFLGFEKGMISKSQIKKLREKSFNYITTDFYKLSKVGITKKIIHLIKNNHNYYDKNYICTCGENGCDNLCIWIIKQETTFCIPFIDYLSRRLHFNIDKLIDLYDCKTEDFDNDDSYNTYPFCFENSDFELYEKTHFLNLKEER